MTRLLTIGALMALFIAPAAADAKRSGHHPRMSWTRSHHVAPKGHGRDRLSDRHRRTALDYWCGTCNDALPALPPRCYIAVVPVPPGWVPPRYPNLPACR